MLQYGYTKFISQFLDQILVHFILISELRNPFTIRSIWNSKTASSNPPTRRPKTHAQELQILSTVCRTFRRVIYILIGDRHLNLNQQDHNLTVIKWLNWRVYCGELDLSLFDVLFIRSHSWRGLTPFQEPLTDKSCKSSGLLQRGFILALTAAGVIKSAERSVKQLITGVSNGCWWISRTRYST